MASSLPGDQIRESEPETSGFSARLQSASLWDLVQMECLARTHGAVRVTSGADSGVLFFDGGRIVHAETARARGEAAAMEILAWQSGSFEPCQAAWPPFASIATASEGLLLRAAQGRDEIGEVRDSNLVAFPGRAAGPTPPEESAPEAWLLTEDDDWEQEVTRPAGPYVSSETGRHPAQPQAPARADDLPVVVRVAPNGTILEATDDDLGDAVAYAGRLAALIGDMMGLDGFRALECASKSERIVMYLDAGGELVAGRVQSTVDITPLRDRLGL